MKKLDYTYFMQTHTLTCSFIREFVGEVERFSDSVARTVLSRGHTGLSRGGRMIVR